MRYPLVRDLAADGIPVAVTCRMLDFSKQAFYKWNRQPVTDRDWDDAHVINAAIDGFDVNAHLPAPFLDAMTSRKQPIPWRVDGVELQVKGVLTRIRALVSQIDVAVGRILECIELARTVVFFTSDHGDYGGHRGLIAKVPWIPFDDLARVPLAVDGRNGPRADPRSVPTGPLTPMLNACSACPDELSAPTGSAPRVLGTRLGLIESLSVEVS